MASIPLASSKATTDRSIDATHLPADPARDIRNGTIIAILFFVVFLGWATFLSLDAATYADGALAVSGQRQTVQHRDGGVVGSILVHEGERVRRGQLLIRLSASR